MIQVKDIAPLLNELEPGMIDEGTEINFADLFYAQVKGFSEGDKEYLLKEYGVLIYKEIPGTAYDSTSNKTKAKREEQKADKNMKHLKENELQARLKKELDKLETDQHMRYKCI